jgi:hypothetical protein
MPCRRKGERQYSSYSFLTSALDGVSGQCHAPAALYPRQRTHGTPCTGGRGSNPGRPGCSHTLYWLSYPSSQPTNVIHPASAGHTLTLKFTFVLSSHVHVRVPQIVSFLQVYKLKFSTPHIVSSYLIYVIIFLAIYIFIHLFILASPSAPLPRISHLFLCNLYRSHDRHYHIHQQTSTRGAVELASAQY